MNALSRVSSGRSEARHTCVNSSVTIHDFDDVYAGVVDGESHARETVNSKPGFNRAYGIGIEMELFVSGMIRSCNK